MIGHVHMSKLFTGSYHLLELAGQTIPVVKSFTINLDYPAWLVFS